MDIKQPPIQCYIGSVINPTIDPYLESKGFSHGLILFSVPELGLLFRCRAEGELIDLEFGAFFSLLRFLKTYLLEDKIKALRVVSSNPEFVFSFKPESKHLGPGTTREKLLKEYTKEWQIEIGYVEPRKNRCYLSTAEYPSMPENTKPILKPTVKNDKKIDCTPFQRGIRL